MVLRKTKEIENRHWITGYGEAGNGQRISYLLIVNYILPIGLLVLFLIMPYIVAVLFNQIACFLGDQLRNFLTCEPYQNFS